VEISVPGKRITTNNKKEEKEIEVVAVSLFV
jgi:hypothetical protein